MRVIREIIRQLLTHSLANLQLPNSLPLRNEVAVRAGMAFVRFGL